MITHNCNDSEPGKTLFLSQTNLSNITHKVAFPITSLTDSLIFNDFSNWKDSHLKTDLPNITHTCNDFLIKKDSPFKSDLPNIPHNVTLPFQIGQLIIGCQALVQVHLHQQFKVSG
jgi:hypothetical protein